MSKNRIITICGCSSCGKDTILKELLSLNLNLLPCISHSTRPIRSNETNHKDYHFISKTEFRDMIVADEFIEMREYKTQFDTWHYGLSKSSIDLSKGNHIVILDLKGLQALKKTVGKENVYSIYLEASPVTRLLRSIERQRQEIEREYVSNKDNVLNEIIRRFDADRKDFSMHNEVCDISLRNETKEDLENIISYIKGLL